LYDRAFADIKIWQSFDDALFFPSDPDDKRVICSAIIDRDAQVNITVC
jgi:hypothetical protein